MKRFFRDRPIAVLALSSLALAMGVSACQLKILGEVQPLTGAGATGSDDGGGGVATDPPVFQTYVFAVNAASATLQVARIDDESGVPVPAPRSPYPLTSPGCVVPSPDGKAVYVGGNNRVHGYHLDSLTGELSEVAGSPVYTGTTNASGRTCPMSITPDGNFLYAGAYHKIWCLAVNPDKSLSFCATPSLATTLDPVGSISVDPSGSHLLLEDPFANQMHTYRIDSSNGSLAAIASNPQPAHYADSVQDILHHSTNGRFYQSGYYGGQIDWGRLDTTTGSLSFAANSPFNTAHGGDRHGITFSRDQKYLYQGHAAGSGSITGFQIDAVTGDLSPMGAPFPVNGLAAPVDLIALPRLSYLLTYDHNAGSSSAALKAFSWNSSDGSLSIIPHAFMWIGAQSFSGSVLASVDVELPGHEQLLFVANETAGSVDVFQIHASTGALTKIASRATTTAGPHLVSAHPGGTFFYTSHGTDVNHLSGFGLSASNALSEVAGSPYDFDSKNGYNLAVSPDGARLYFETIDNGSNLTVYSIDQSTGALTDDAGGPYLIDWPRSMVFHPSGRALYKPEGSGVTAYRIDRATGAPSDLAASPHADNYSVHKSVALHPSGRYLWHWGSDSWGANIIRSYLIGPDDDLIAGPTLTLNSQDPGQTAGAVAGGFKYVYFMRQDTGLILIYSFDPATGALSPAGTPSFDLGTTGANFMISSKDGKYLYVSDGSNGHIRAFSTSPATGALTEISGSPFAAGAGAFGMDTAIRVSN